MQNSQAGSTSAGADLSVEVPPLALGRVAVAAAEHETNKRVLTEKQIREADKEREKQERKKERAEEKEKAEEEAKSKARLSKEAIGKASEKQGVAHTHIKQPTTPRTAPKESQKK